MNSKKMTHAVRKGYARHTALAAAIAMGMGLSGQVFAQATTGSVFGTAPVSSGETVKVVSNQTGLTREVSVGSDGRYGANQLPIGDYTVSLMHNGNAVATRDHVQVSVSGGTAVAFTASSADKNIQNLAGVTVSANALPAIDVSSTRQTQVITAQQLKSLPLAHSAEAIALLAPGVNLGGGSLGTGPTGTPLVSFGGNSVVENAYYLNGFNTTDPIGGAGGIALPYFAIAEQQTITSGYGPEYGRSTGGVISQIGKRGSNDFHAGVYVSWLPSWAQGNFDNVHYSNPLTPVGALDNGYNPKTGTFGPGSPILAPGQGTTAYAPGYGQIQTGKKQNSDWETVYDAYVSGPLIKDKLFFFITAEWQHDSNQGGLQNFGVTSPQGYYQSQGSKNPKLYGKLDWNINDNNVLELTGAQTKHQETTNNFYNYNYTDQKVGDFYGPGIIHKDTFKVGILKYTSYITDNLTLEMQYGVMGGQYYSGVSGPNVAPVTFGAGVAVPPGVVVPNLIDVTVGNPGHTTKTENLRIDLDWKITADHDIKFGIDNLQYRDDDDGSSILGGGAYNYYNDKPSNFASSTPFIGNPGYGEYVVQNLVSQNVTIASREKAQYVEDKWQVTPNLLLDLGLRNDQFSNLGPAGVAYVRETKPQWAPRLGFSWDVMGDSTMKIFGNAGRYYLALPAGLAARNSAFGSINGAIVGTYQGIGPTGLPIGVNPLAITQAPGTTGGYFSSDGENGVPGNIKNYSSTNLKAQYQDEYVLGFQKMLGNTGLVFGTQASYQKAGNLVDDVDINYEGNVIAGLVNPGKTNYIRQPDGVAVWNPNTGEGVYTAGQPFLPYPKPSRKYYALDTFLQHTWDGKWFGKIDYLFSKSYGSSEGATNTALGQITNQSNGGFSGSTTAAWDFPDLMQYANGTQANDHRHTIKAFGSYAITPEWMVSGTLIMQTGSPNACMSGFGGAIYGDAYAGPYQHYCGGVPTKNSTVTVIDPASGLPVPVGYGGLPSAPGDSGRTPWLHQLNLSLTYTPDWAHKHLTVQAEVHNVLNEQKATLYYTQYAIGPGGTFSGNNSGTSQYNPVYHTARSTEAPRYMAFNAKYDF